MNNTFQQYYTKSKDITDYMLSKLNLVPNAKVLEPCAGDGVLIDALLDCEKNLSIDAFEIDPTEAKNLKEKYKNLNSIRIINSDTLIDLRLHEPTYDFILANPPYGAWQDYTKRIKLKKLYPNLYIKETYSTFLFQAIHLLKDKGKLVFIIPDTYLNLHRHSFLRKTLLEKTKIDEISIFPSNFFPNINFGYSNLSIISLEKCEEKSSSLKNKFLIYKGFKHPRELSAHGKLVIKHELEQKDVYHNLDFAFILSKDTKIVDLIRFSKNTIGDVASCVTGFYSGNDKRFVKVVDPSIKNCASYEKIHLDEIYQGIKPPLEGLESCSENTYIPLIKGGRISYYKHSHAFLNWSRESVYHYKKDKKARYQNSQFYFKEGVGVPMVSSKKISASLIDGRLFDQSIVGIFPKNSSYLYYLLGFFNSSVANLLLRSINPSANNSANYIKKIPFIFPDMETLNIINKLVSKILELKKEGINSEILEEEVDNIFSNIYLDNFDYKLITSE